MKFPVRPLKAGWPKAVQTKHLGRFFWPDPRVIAREDATPEQFRTAMAAVHVGATIKITGVARHRAADDLVVENLHLTGATIVDIGASDGSTSLELIPRLGDFNIYVLSDLFFLLSAAELGRHFLLFDRQAECILVSGRRWVGWPTLSPVVGWLYAPLIRRSRRAPRQDVLLLNPAVRALMAADQRVSWQTHDVFTPWPGPAPDLIKVANLLRRLYFSDNDILRALSALLASLNEGGHLLIVDNPRIAGIDCRGGLYRRTGGSFVEVATTKHRPEIADLIEQVSVAGRVIDLSDPQPNAPVRLAGSNSARGAQG